MRTTTIPQVDEFPKHLTDRFENGIRLGMGCYAETRATKDRPNEVIKQTRNKDDGYAAYLGVVLANQSNPHFPRIYEAVQRKSDKAIMVRMERLEKISWRDDKRNKKARQILECLYYNLPEIRSFYTSLHFVQLHAAMRYLRHELGRSMDLHAGNGMLRGNTLVVTDPCT